METNIHKLPEQDINSQAVEVLDFLNEKAGRHYRPVDVNLNFIKARIKSGIEPRHLKAIVAMKVRESKDGDYDEKWLRPATLFNETRCEQYFGALDI